ncbi:MAG: DUF4363 family protein [Oscillospiraceae bacterium]|nr:DUF4363 family protein [Oscillospiraceae bacterium]
MKKEIAAAIILIALFAGVMVNIKVSGNIILSLEDDVTAAYESARNGDFDRAKPQLDAAIEHWMSLDGYTHIFMRHSEINSTTEAYFQLKSDIYAEDIGAAEGSYSLLMADLDSLMTMEQISFGSIF